MILLGVALATVLAQAPGERNPSLMLLEAPNTRTIAKGDQSHIDDAKQVVVRTDAEWTKLWQ